jgi:hydroxymethylglutaryl-CoA reductase
VSNGTRIYLNGVSVLTTTITIQSQVANLFGGAEANAGQYAACQISSFNMYNRALTAQEVLQNYNATKGRFR